MHELKIINLHAINGGDVGPGNANYDASYEAGEWVADRIREGIAIFGYLKKNIGF